MIAVRGVIGALLGKVVAHCFVKVIVFIPPLYENQTFV